MKAMTKQEAIKKIEKITGTSRIVIYEEDTDEVLFPNDYTFVTNWDWEETEFGFYNNKVGSGFVIKNNSLYEIKESEYKSIKGFKHFKNLPIKQEWLEPLSRLIPILFKEGE